MYVNNKTKIPEIAWTLEDIQKENKKRMKRLPDWQIAAHSDINKRAAKEAQLRIKKKLK